MDKGAASTLRPLEVRETEFAFTFDAGLKEETPYQLEPIASLATERRMLHLGA